MSSTETALSDLVWATMPLLNTLKDDQRAALVTAIANGTAALSGRDPRNQEHITNPRAAAEDLHRQCLLACLSLGVKPHDLAPQFNQLARGAGEEPSRVAYHLAKTGKLAAATAHSFISEREGNS